MRRTEGNCIHCGRYVVREQDGTLVSDFTQMPICGSPEDDDPHQLDDEPAYECVYCDKEFTTEPVRDPDEVAWRGLWARIYCSEECMVKYGERATSNGPLGRSDPR